MPALDDFMNPSHVLWSAQACPFRRAGAYFGLVSAGSLHLVSRWLLPKRAHVYSGGSVMVRDDGPWPLVHLAVRDPSSVRVIPVRDIRSPRPWQPPATDYPYVSLVFEQDRNATAVDLSAHPDAARELAALEEQADRGLDAGFIVTIGLRSNREREFFERVVLAHPDQRYAQLCERITALKDEFAE